MSGINQSVVLDVSRIKVEFVDPIGNRRSISGTGFWLSDQDTNVFVTNRHNVDPIIKLGEETEYSLGRLEIELRRFNGQQPSSATSFFEVDLTNSIVTCSQQADVAVIKAPVFSADLEDFNHGGGLRVPDLADALFHISKVALMDIASFIGFPGTSHSQWWDQQWNLGVARLVNIASLPGVQFTHPDLRTNDVTLVAGLSFSGSSGSVVMLHEKGVRVGDGLSNPGYVPPKILGIMSGHWWDRDAPAMFNHSGLSYYTRSTSILALL